MFENSNLSSKMEINLKKRFFRLKIFFLLTQKCFFNKNCLLGYIVWQSNVEFHSASAKEKKYQNGKKSNRIETKRLFNSCKGHSIEFTIIEM